jgi:hypothetical protein
MTRHRVRRNWDEAARFHPSFRKAGYFFLAGLGVEVAALPLMAVTTTYCCLA